MQVITNVGIAAENAAIAAGEPLKIKSIVLGDKTPTGDLRQATRLLRKKDEHTCKVVPDATDPSLVYAELRIPNPAEAYTINEIGVELEDGTLYSYGPGRGDTVPAAANNIKDAFIVRVAIKTHNSDVEVVQLDKDAVYATIGQLAHTHTKAEIGLDKVANLSKSSEVSLNSTNYYATSKAVYTVNKDLQDYKLTLNKVNNFPISHEPASNGNFSKEKYASEYAVFWAIQNFFDTHFQSEGKAKDASKIDGIDGGQITRRDAYNQITGQCSFYGHGAQVKIQGPTATSAPHISFTKGAGTSEARHAYIQHNTSYFQLHNDSSNISVRLHNGANRYFSVAFGDNPRFYVNSAGNGYFDGAVVARSTSNPSDINLKNVHQYLDKDNCLKAICGISPAEFSYKDMPEKNFVGHIAQDVQKHIPHAVEKSTNINGKSHLIVDPIPIIANLVGAVGRLNEKVEALEKRLASMEGD